MLRKSLQCYPIQVSGHFSIHTKKIALAETVLTNSFLNTLILEEDTAHTYLGFKIL